MDHSNPYERAFAALLRQWRVGYIAVNETRRSLVEGEPVKSLDFIVYGPTGVGLLVDVKGRKYPGVTAGRRRYVWECWVAAEDVIGMQRWVTRFGPNYRGVLAFVYQLAPDITIADSWEEIWEYCGKRYRLRAVVIDDYEQAMRTRSPSWGTVDLPARIFQSVATPMRELIGQVAVGNRLPSTRNVPEPRHEDTGF